MIPTASAAAGLVDTQDVSRVSAGDPAPSRIAVASLIWTLVQTDFKARYHGTLSGFVWALLKPLTMFVVLEAVFSVIFRSDRHYRLDLMIGLFLWNFFAEATSTAMTSLHTKGFLLTRAKLPSWILVVCSISNASITVAVFAAAMCLLLGAAAGPLPIALFLLYIVGLAAVCVGIGLGTSPLFVRYRDLNQVWDVMIQAGFFVAPIIYPIGILPERVHIFLYLWPPTPFIQFSRAVLVDGSIPGPRAHIILLVGIATILAGGMASYRVLSRRAAEFL